MLGNRHFTFAQSLAEKLIPVDRFSHGRRQSPVARKDPRGVWQAIPGLERLSGRHFVANEALRVGFGFAPGRTPSFGLRAITTPCWCRSGFLATTAFAITPPLESRRELGSLALPREFLQLRGKTITVTVGKPISPDMLRAIPSRRAQTNFLRAAVYEMGRQRREAADGCRHAVLPSTSAVTIGKDLEVLASLEHASAMRIGSVAATATMDIGDATYHVLLTPRGVVAPIVHWQVLDWSQFTNDELNQISPLRKSYRLPADVARTTRNWLEHRKLWRQRQWPSLSADAALGDSIAPSRRSCSERDRHSRADQAAGNAGCTRRAAVCAPAKNFRRRITAARQRNAGADRCDAPARLAPAARRRRARSKLPRRYAVNRSAASAPHAHWFRVRCHRPHRGTATPPLHSGPSQPGRDGELKCQSHTRRHQKPRHCATILTLLSPARDLRQGRARRAHSPNSRSGRRAFGPDVISRCGSDFWSAIAGRSALRFWYIAVAITIMSFANTLLRLVETAVYGRAVRRTKVEVTRSSSSAIGAPAPRCCAGYGSATNASAIRPPTSAWTRTISCSPKGCSRAG